MRAVLYVYFVRMNNFIVHSAVYCLPSNVWMTQHFLFIVCVHAQCIMGVEFFLLIWQNRRKQPFFSSGNPNFIFFIYLLHRQPSFTKSPFCQRWITPLNCVDVFYQTCQWSELFIYFIFLHLKFVYEFLCLAKNEPLLVFHFCTENVSGYVCNPGSLRSKRDAAPATDAALISV